MTFLSLTPTIVIHTCTNVFIPSVTVYTDCAKDTMAAGEGECGKVNYVLTKVLTLDSYLLIIHETQQH